MQLSMQFVHNKNISILFLISYLMLFHTSLIFSLKVKITGSTPVRATSLPDTS